MDAWTILIAAGLAWGVIALVQSFYGLGLAARFARLVFERREPADFAPVPATILLPCKGVDPELPATLHGLFNQRYPDYEVIAIVDSTSDRAWAVLQQAAAQPRSAGCRDFRVLVAPAAVSCSQKIMNLLTGIAAAAARSEIFAFVDSDAVPNPGWLAALAAPLSDQRVGATTGFRWYAPTGGLSGLARTVWNAAALPYMAHPYFSFAWGGSCALRRATFERVGLAESWKRALSDDFELTRAMRAAGLQITFVPACLTPTHDAPGWRRFWDFAHRQLVIVRVCQPWMWRLATATSFSFCGALLVTAAATLAAAAQSALILTLLGLVLFIDVWMLAAIRAAVVHRAARQILPDPALHRGALLLETWGAPLVGLMHLVLLVSAGGSRRFWWRGVRYEFQSPTDLRILERTPGFDLSIQSE